MKHKITTRSEDETIEIAENIEAEKFSGMTICLIGELGSGKTLFTKAFAQAMGIKENITSPTFNIIKEYQGELDLYHMDVYRLNGNIEGTGILDYFNKKGVSIIEWADLIEEHLPKERLEITFKVIGENSRILIIKPYGEKYIDLCERVF